MSSARTLTRIALPLLLLAVPATGTHAATVQGYDKQSPLEGANWMLDEGLYVKIHNFEDGSNYTDFLEIVNRTYTAVRKDGWNVGAQLDAVVNAPPDTGDGPVNPLFGSEPPPHLTEDGYLLPEKVFLQYRTRHFRMDFGDYYINVGKGIALSLTKRTEIDQDTSLRGAKFGVTSDNVDWNLFGGWANAQNISVVAINRNMMMPAHELVFGTAGLIRPHSAVEIGVHAVGSTFERTEVGVDRLSVDHLNLIDEPVQLGVFGGSVRFPSLGPLDWYTEGDLFVYGKSPTGETATFDHEGTDKDLDKGYAIYTGAQIFGDPVSFQVEFKRYHNHLQQSRLSGVTDNALTAAPTLELEEAIQPDSQHAVTSNDMTGYRLRWTAYIPKTAHSLFFNFANFFDDYDVAGHDREVIIHPYVGTQLFFDKGHHIFFTGGYRGEFNVEDDSPTGKDYGNDMMIHAYFDGAVVVKASTLELSTNFRTFHEATDDPYDWISSESSLSWNYKGVLTVAVLFDVTNERSALSGPLAVPGNILNRDDADDPLGIFGAAEVTIRPAPGMGIKVFAGANKQGLRCTGGVCRWLPGFSGFRTELTFSL